MIIANALLWSSDHCRFESCLSDEDSEAKSKVFDRSGNSVSIVKRTVYRFLWLVNFWWMVKLMREMKLEHIIGETWQLRVCVKYCYSDVAV